MYPEGCGYHSKTGGLMEALRKLDVETSILILIILGILSYFHTFDSSFVSYK